MKAVTKSYPLNPTEKIPDLKALTDRSARIHAKAPAFRTMLSKTEYETKTYEEFGRELCELANAFIDNGWQDKRIALIGENSYRWLLSYFAVVNTGATVVPLDKELDKEEIADLIKRSDSSILIHSENYDEEAVFAVKKVKGLKTVSLGKKKSADNTFTALLDQGKDILSSGTDKYSGIELDREKVCSILFTSGTTGKSKGVMLCHRNLAANVVSACENVKFEPDDVAVSILPIHHSYEDMCGIFGPMNYGSCIAFCEEIKRLPDALALFKPTIMVLVPLYVETFYRKIWNAAREKRAGEQAEDGYKDRKCSGCHRYRYTRFASCRR